MIHFSIRIRSASVSKKQTDIEVKRLQKFFVFNKSENCDLSFIIIKCPWQEICNFIYIFFSFILVCLNKIIIENSP